MARMHASTHRTWVGAAVASLLALSAITVVSCRGTEGTTPSPAISRMTPPKNFVMRADVAVRFAQAHEKFGWVGLLHARAMAEAIRERAAWSSNSTDFATRNCALSERIGLKYAALARGYAGVDADVHADSTMVASALASQGCSSSMQMSIFARPQPSLSLRALNVSAVDGEFEYYGNAMIDAAYNSSGTYWGIHNATLLALDDAYDYVDEFDFNGLAAEADFIDSSAETWVNYQQSGGFGPEQVWQTSIFRIYMWPWGLATCGSACKHTLRNDALGYVGGFLTAGRYGGIDGAILGGTVWGIIGSLQT